LGEGVSYRDTQQTMHVFDSSIKKFVDAAAGLREQVTRGR
jgi:hypothetical protein